MRQFLGKLALVSVALVWIVLSNANADNVPKHAEGLNEVLITVRLDDQRTQSGVLSVKKGTTNHSTLVVLIPGYPAVFRPVVKNGILVRSKLKGNFLIRARRHLVSDNIMSLLIDCHSESGAVCELDYQSSAQRQEDVHKLINKVLELSPSVNNIWLIGTSMGTMSSAFMPQHDKTLYAGVIHTATLTETKKWYPQLRQFDYSATPTPQFFIHHAEDPCLLTQYRKIKKIANRDKIPLITVFGGRGFKGEACNAFTQHGFRGMEIPVMLEIQKIIGTGKPSKLEIR